MLLRQSMILGLLALLAQSAAMAAEGPRQPAAATVELRDQLGGRDSVAAHRGEVTVGMVVTAARLRNLKAWQRDLQKRIEALEFVLIADIPSEPPVSFERVANHLSERVPGEVPVLIDLDRLWAEELDLDTARPNILLFDREGALVERYRGLATQALVDQVVARLEALVGG